MLQGCTFTVHSTVTYHLQQLGLLNNKTVLINIGNTEESLEKMTSLFNYAKILHTTLRITNLLDSNS